ncbi:taste receptor type 2 member 43-like [Gastrophryne carolinensis]
MAAHSEIEYYIPYLRFVAAGGFLLSGLIFQLFIVAVNVTERLKGRLMSATDQIITLLGVSRLIFHFTSFWCIVQTSFKIQMHIHLLKVIIFISSFSFSSNTWLSVLLSILFCLKISNVNKVFFLRLKTMMSRRVGFFIAACLLWCAILAFIRLELYFSPSNNFTNAKISSQKSGFSKTAVLLLGNIVPLLIYLPSSALLAASLCHHMYIMRRGGSTTGSMATYLRTLAFIIVSFLLFSVHVITNITGWYNLFTIDVLGIHCISHIFPIIHTLYVIHVTTKLKDQLCGIFQSGTKCLFKRRAPEPDIRDTVEMVNQ